MKYLIALALVFALNSCNTFIGIGRDSRQAYDWTKGKIQSSSGGGSADSDGAPIY